LTALVQRFAVLGFDAARPEGERIIFCDGAGGRLFHEDTDLELSHWRPNRTPVEYRAATSTEICFRFLDAPRVGGWTVAVNNHLDVDGILSVYTLVHRDQALSRRTELIQAAEMGDFWEWGDPPAQRVFQGLTQLIHQEQEMGLDATTIYANAFTSIPHLLEGADPAGRLIDASLAPLRHGVDLVEQGKIVRSLLSERLAHYVVPVGVVGDDPDRALYIPGFNEEISDAALLWPHVRARWDAERVCLVSVESPGGWFHGLWMPGYLWADTAGRWRTPGVEFHDGMEGYEVIHPPLVRAWQDLQMHETARGVWSLANQAFAFQADLQDRFPLTGRFVDDAGRWAPSRLSPHQVAVRLMDVFASW
jgi:hypothetical protein